MKNRKHILAFSTLAAAMGTGVLTAPVLGQQLLFDQQPIVLAGAGFNGAGVIERHNGVMGYQARADQDNRVADDFAIGNVPNASGWLVTSFKFWAIECDDSLPPPAVPTSSITGLYYRIWDDVPESPGAQVIFGDLETNVLADTGFAGMYRVQGPGDHLATSWPVKYATANVFLYLPKNRIYWIEYGFDSAGAVCENQPAVPANHGVAGNALAVVNGTAPRPTDPRAYGCPGNAMNAFDALPIQIFGQPIEDPSFLDPSCVSLPNSAGTAAQLMLLGTGTAGDDLMATVSGGVPGQFGYFISGPNSGLYVIPPGSGGIVCIAGPQYRYNGSAAAAAHVFQFDAAGNSQLVGPAGGPGPVILETDGSFAPVPAVMAGSTRAFQAWYRDVGGASGNSNFSTSRRVTFL